MSLQRVAILLGKELWYGPKNFIFIFAIVLPVVLSLVLSLALGSLFSEKPRLGIVDQDSSQLVTMFQELDSVDYEQYATVSEIKQAVESGGLDMGLVLPDGFDNAVMRGEGLEITAYIWGESLAKNRAILGVTVANLIREMAGQEAPVDIVAIALGDEVSVPWSDRLLPLIVLMTVFLGGLFIPAISVINEKEKKTLEALVITPASIGDIFLAKGLLGFILSLSMGILVLVLNQAFGAQPLLLIMMLALGAVMASEIGLICGALIKDTTILFTIWKTGGIVLFGPALIYMFPNIPQWIGRVFPTYYFVDPVVAISQRGSGWPEIATNVFILIGLDIILIGVVGLVLKRARQFAT